MSVYFGNSPVFTSVTAKVLQYEGLSLCSTTNGFSVAPSGEGNSIMEANVDNASSNLFLALGKKVYVTLSKHFANSLIVIELPVTLRDHAY